MVVVVIFIVVVLGVSCVTRKESWRWICSFPIAGFLRWVWSIRSTLGYCFCVIRNCNFNVPSTLDSLLRRTRGAEGARSGASIKWETNFWNEWMGWLWAWSVLGVMRVRRHEMKNRSIWELYKQTGGNKHVYLRNGAFVYCEVQARFPSISDQEAVNHCTS